uniref:Uncharacterized protein n=1 Tax=Eutreptiella gymnastica TaxID=73025 RepID=A0A7S1JFZ3_9EUGL|mmetsp:Transcript_93359/g.161799  ORF Transcript_93359/g.161799 Transcript_93359/m.161799 type:complete len:132 (+) Transcript_93359:103-498(+)
MQEVQEMSQADKVVWPVCLGVGPFKGALGPVMKLGGKEAPKYMFKVLEFAVRAYKCAQGHSDWPGQFEWHSEWVPGMHDKVLVRWGKEPAASGVEVQPHLGWCLRSVVRLQSTSEPLRLQVWQQTAFLTEW